MKKKSGVTMTENNKKPVKFENMQTSSIVKKNELVDSISYIKALEQIKTDIQQSQLRAAISVTKELTMLYWRIGKMLSEKVSTEGWGAKVIEKLARDLAASFPDLSGFSFRNMKYMRQFAECYQDPNWAAAAAQIPWGHNMLILDVLEDIDQRIWYVKQTIENGWSRSTLDTWIKSNLYRRQGKAPNNFKITLPSPQSDLAEQIVKDPYNFSFLEIDRKHRERELEQGLMDHIQKFLLELGDGFAFVGRQYEIEVNRKTYKIDLLFYHLKLRAYCLVELKATDFDPKYTGQMNFYLSAVDDLLRHESDNPSIGILICKSKDKIEVEYALRRCSSPISVTSYETEIVKKLPKELKASLPSVEEIERELGERESTNEN